MELQVSLVQQSNTAREESPMVLR